MDKQLRHQIGQMIIAGFPSLEVDDQARRLALGAASAAPGMAIP